MIIKIGKIVVIYMTGLSNISTYKDGGYSVTKIRFSNGDSMSFRKVKNGSSKKIKPGYNYKLISAAILRAKTPNGASQAAMKARQKLGELLRSSQSGENDDPDLKAAIVHVKKMEMIAKRKKKHLEQEKMAERGQPALGEEEEKTEEVLNGMGGTSEKDAEKEFEEEEAHLAEEIEQMEQEMNEEMLREFSELSEELAENEQKMLEEEMQGLEGFEDVTNMSPEDVKELKRKHRNDEWRDITKADMDFLKAKFYRLQQEKAAAGIKGTFGSYDSGASSFIADAPIDISVDSSMDMDFPVGDMGVALDTFV